MIFTRKAYIVAIAVLAITVCYVARSRRTINHSRIKDDLGAEEELQPRSRKSWNTTGQSANSTLKARQGITMIAAVNAASNANLSEVLQPVIFPGNPKDLTAESSTSQAL